MAGRVFVCRMRRAAPVLLAVATAAVILPAPAALGAESHTASCPKVLFVGVRGSGEPASLNNGFGGTVQIVRDGFTASLPTTVSYRSVALAYPAAPVPLDSVSRAAWDSLLQSISDGTRALDRVLTASARDCTGRQAQRWVLAGYSQGALVVNQAMRNFPASHFAQVDLIGDPARVPDQVGTQTGSALPGYGITALIKIAKVTGPLPHSFAGVTSSLCDEDDLICDYSHLKTAAQATYGETVHTTYDSRDYSTLYWMGVQAARRAAGTGRRSSAPALSGAAALGSVPAGQPLTSTVTGYAPGEPVQVVLDSDQQILGTVRASGRGILRYTLTVPSTLSAGQHRLVFVSGTGAVSKTFWIGPVPAPTSAPSKQAAAQPHAAARRAGSGIASWLVPAGAAAVAVVAALAAALLRLRRSRA